MRYSQIQIRTQTQTQAQLKSTLTLQDLLSLLNHRRLLALLSLMLSSIILTATSIMMSVISEEICIQPATLTLFVTRVEACTAAHHAPSHIMLKSYDWKDGRGDLYLNPRDIKRIALPHESAQISLRDKSSSYGGPLSWRARYASVTFNQYGRGFPNGGINEAGLAVEVLWLNESQAPTPDARPYLNELEWVQYLLDTASNVQDAISSSQPIRITDPRSSSLLYV